MIISDYPAAHAEFESLLHLRKRTTLAAMYNYSVNNGARAAAVKQQDDSVHVLEIFETKVNGQALPLLMRRLLMLPKNEVLVRPDGGDSPETQNG